MSRTRKMIEEVLRGRDPRKVFESGVQISTQPGESLASPWKKGDRVSWTGRPDAKPGTVREVQGEHVSVNWDDGTISEVLWGELVAIEKTEGLTRLRRLRHEEFKPGDRVELTDDSELDPGASGTVVNVFDGGAEVRFDPPSDLGMIAVQNGEIHKLKEGRRRQRREQDEEPTILIDDQQNAEDYGAILTGLGIHFQAFKFQDTGETAFFVAEDEEEQALELADTLGIR